MKKMIEEKTWDEFRETGLFMFINTVLHVFGWVLVYETNGTSTNFSRVYPARTKFRGFHPDSIDRMHERISLYLKDNIQSIVDDTFELNDDGQ